MRLTQTIRLNQRFNRDSVHLGHIPFAVAFLAVGDTLQSFAVNLFSFRHGFAPNIPFHSGAKTLWQVP